MLIYTHKTFKLYQIILDIQINLSKRYQMKTNIKFNEYRPSGVCILKNKRFTIPSAHTYTYCIICHIIVVELCADIYAYTS